MLWPIHVCSFTQSPQLRRVFSGVDTKGANLDESYGIVGGLAYATYWLSIPLAGWVIYSIRRSIKAQSLVGFLVGKYGRLAAFSFTLAILIRLIKASI